VKKNAEALFKSVFIFQIQTNQLKIGLAHVIQVLSVYVYVYLFFHALRQNKTSQNRVSLKRKKYRLNEKNIKY
jgi:hypothetical protein